MGSGIAYVSALAGLNVMLLDRDQESADKGKAKKVVFIENGKTVGNAEVK